jgi:hypothetical protein
MYFFKCEGLTQPRKEKIIFSITFFSVPSRTIQTFFFLNSFVSGFSFFPMDIYAVSLVLLPIERNSQCLFLPKEKECLNFSEEEVKLPFF